MRELRVTGITICRPGEDIDAVGTTTVSIREEGAGEFIYITRIGGDHLGFGPEEWLAIREAVDRLLDGRLILSRTKS